MIIGFIFPEDFNPHYIVVNITKYIEGVIPSKIISNHSYVSQYAKDNNIPYEDATSQFFIIRDGERKRISKSKEKTTLFKYIVNNCDKVIVYDYFTPRFISEYDWENGFITFVKLDKIRSGPSPNSYTEVTIQKNHHYIKEIRDHDYERVHQKIIIYEYDVLQYDHYPKMILDVLGGNIDVSIYGTDFLWIEEKIKSILKEDYSSNNGLNFKLTHFCDIYTTLFEFDGYTGLYFEKDRITLESAFTSQITDYYFPIKATEFFDKLEIFFK